MAAASFRCEVLLANPVPPSWERVAALIGTHFAARGVAVELRPGPGGDAALLLDGTAVEAHYIARPSPDRRATAAHAAFIVLWWYAGADDAAARQAAARALTMVAAALSLRSDCAGLLWQDAPALHPTGRLRKAGRALAEGRDPIGLWIATGPGGRGEGRRTEGLADFFGEELVIAEPDAPPELAEQALAGLLRYLFESGDRPQDLAAFRIAEIGDFTLAPATEAGPDAPCRRVRLIARAGERAGERISRGATAPRRPPMAEGAGGRTAAVLFLASAPPAAEAQEAIRRHLRRSGERAELRERAGERLLVDWGSLRTMGHRQTMVSLAWTLPEPLGAFAREENPGLAAALPALLAGSAPVLVAEAEGIAPAPPGVPAALLVAEVAAALLGLPGARGILWVPSARLMTAEAALPLLRRAKAELPLPLWVAELALEPAPGERVFVTRGLAELGEREVLLTGMAPDDARGAGLFHSLVRAVFERRLVRRGETHRNSLDGTEYTVTEDEIVGFGPVLAARPCAAPAAPPGLLGRLRGIGRRTP